MPEDRQLADLVETAGLTGAQLRVAEVFVEEAGVLGFHTAAGIGALAGVSDATVVRTAQCLGFSGLAELKRFVAERMGSPVLSSRLRTTIADASASGSALLEAVRVQRRALERLESLAATPAFDEAVDVLGAARRVVVNGTGPSAALAEYTCLLLQRVGADARSVTQTGAAAADELIGLRPGDAVLVLAYTRLHRHVAVLLERASALGLPVVFCTDVLRPPATGRPQVVLDTVRGAPGSFASHGATLVLLEALAVALAARTPERSAQSLDLLNELRARLAGRRMDVDRGR